MKTIPVPKKIEQVSVESLKPYEKNSRTHSEEQIEELAEGIKEFGWGDALIISGETIIAGHGRLMAAKKLGWKTVPCIRMEHLSKEQQKAFAIFHNKIAEKAGWDSEILAEELSSLKSVGYDLNFTGFNEDEILDMGALGDLDKEPEEGNIGDDDVPEVEQNIFNVKRGDIWQLGEHRLMCGDSTHQPEVSKLMNGQKADMVFTDPPYNLASDCEMSTTTSSNAHKNLQNSEWDKDFIISGALKNIEKFIKKDSTIYICTSHFILPEILIWMKKFDKSHCCIWSKKNPMPSLTKRSWTWSHEFIAYATKGKHTFNFPEEGHALSVWEIPKPSKNDLHPTQKPIEVSQHGIIHSSKQKDLVLDLFLGSGSTLIACQKNHRVCYGMELDPHYCSVIIERWQNFTDKSAKLVESEEPVEEQATKKVKKINVKKK